MTQSGSFDKLIANLDIEERQNLLKKLSGQFNMPDALLYTMDKDVTAAEDIKSEYTRLPWYYRLWYFVLSFFDSKSSIKIYEDKRVSALGMKIENKSPGLYDYRTATLLPVFYSQLENLKEAAHFFYSALDSSVNRDKRAFFAFLGSLEIPEIHKRLEKETDPMTIAENHPKLSDSELRQVALKTMDDLLLMITEECRNAMYFDSRTLNCLKGLSSYLYDRVLMAFNHNAAVKGNTCSAGIVRGLLINLNDILLSLKIAPPMTLLESLFVFILSEKAGEQGFEINREIQALSLRAEESLTVIKEFNEKVPLTWILRCVTRDMSLSPKEISGGEDWFVFYRDYWKKRIESQYTDFVKDRRQEKLTKSFRLFFKGKDIKMLANVHTDILSDGLPLKRSYSLSFLSTFYTLIFVPYLNYVLKPIFAEGEFQKKENRVEFIESYNSLAKLKDGISKLDYEMSHEGEYGNRYAQARKEMTSPASKRRKMEIVMEDADGDAETILLEFRNTAQSLMNVLSGVLGKESGNKYFPLLNLSVFEEKDKQFLPGLNETLSIFHKALGLLDDIDVMESRR